MKKILLFCLLMTPLLTLAEDFDLDIKIPEWKDFAPKAYVDVQEPGKFKKINVSASYWYDRKVKFEEGLELCALKDSPNEKYICYEDLKVEQYKENTDYNARIEARQRAAAGIPEMTDRTDVMLPINNYINTFNRFMPNEIR